MSLKSRISRIAKFIAHPIVSNLPLFIVWVVALAIGAVCDLPKLWQLEYPSMSYILGLLRIMTCSVALSVIVAYLFAAVARWTSIRLFLSLLAF